MTKFVDLYLRVPISDVEKSKKIIAKSAELGYRLVAVPFPPFVKREKIESIKKICNDVDIDLSPRINFFPKDTRELINGLRSFRRKFEIVSISCASKSVARQAAKDHRVDLLIFPVVEKRKTFFDNAEANLVSRSGASLEIDMTRLLSSEGFQRMRQISILRREVTIANHFGVPIILSSGAISEQFLRKPQDYAFLAMLFNMDQLLALKALSDVPFNRVELNRQKLGPDFVAPGIRVIRRVDP
jgi:RNase P/RNase MRP subunit p30